MSVLTEAQAKANPFLSQARAVDMFGANINVHLKKKRRALDFLKSLATTIRQIVIQTFYKLYREATRYSDKMMNV